MASRKAQGKCALDADQHRSEGMGPMSQSDIRSDPIATDRHPVGRKPWTWTSRLLTVAAVVVIPWVALLTAQLHGGATRRSLGSSWIGLDLIEIVGLLVVGSMLRRRHRATSPVAAATAAVLILDAWFDLMSSTPRLAYVQSLLLAFLIEIPFAVLLICVASQTLAWAAPSDRVLPTETHGSNHGE